MEWGKHLFPTCWNFDDCSALCWPMMANLSTQESNLLQSGERGKITSGDPQGQLETCIRISKASGLAMCFRCAMNMTETRSNGGKKKHDGDARYMQLEIHQLHSMEEAFGIHPEQRDAHIYDLCIEIVSLHISINLTDLFCEPRQYNCSTHTS